MNIASFSVHRPVFTVMVALIVIILGVISLVRIPVDLMPDITNPTISISTTYENASPEEMERLVTRPLEEALSAVPGVKEVSSTSSEGSSNIRVGFVWGTDLDAAVNDVRDRLDRVIPRLPDDVERPSLRKFDMAAFPVLILGASGDLDPLQMQKTIEDHVKYRIERVAGVASLDVWGGFVREIQVDLDLDKIRAFDIPLSQVTSRIRAANVDRPAGTVRQGHLDLRVRVPGTFQTVDELRDTIILERANSVVHLRDVAVVRDTWQKETRLVRVNGKRGVRMSVNKQSGTNTVDVAKAVMVEINEINRDMPQLQISAIIDSSRYIERSINNVSNSALYGGALAVVVLLFFLRDLASTLVIAVSIPVSIVATFAMVYFNGYTLNIMTLGGLALGVGMLVDNSIVVLENIARMRAEKRDAKLSAVLGAEEVSSAIIASTVTTLVVFLPLIFVRGMAGIMFTQLSMVVGFSLLCSLVAALTLVPMLTSRLKRTDHGSKGGWRERLYEWSGACFDHLEDGYKQLLHLALNHKKWVVIGAALMFVGSMLLAGRLGTELMPNGDEGEVRIDGELAVGSNLEVVDRQFKKIEAIVREMVPEIDNMVVSVGGNNWHSSGGHKGEIRIALVEQAKRTRSSEDIAQALRMPLSAIPGVTVRTRVGQGLRIMRMGASSDERVSVEIRGHDFDLADGLASQVVNMIENVDGVTDSRISRDSGRPERRLVIDRSKAADLGLTVNDVAAGMETVLGGVSAGNFRDEGDEYRILVHVPSAEYMDVEQVLDVCVVNRSGDPVVLRNVVSVETSSGPTMIERKNQERFITVSANISGRDLGSVMTDVQEGLTRIAVPEGFEVIFGGDYEDQQESFQELLTSLVLAVLLVYMVMASQFESLRDPFVVMFSIPLAGVGVVLMLFLTGTTINIQSFIGCIMLAGIVVNNAILLVDHTNLLRRRDGMPLRDAIEEAGRRRLRPILMTTMTTVLGLMPLALGLGEGGEAQAPMARAVIGGLISSTAITLLLVPVVYAVFERHRADMPDVESVQATD